MLCRYFNKEKNSVLRFPRIFMAGRCKTVCLANLFCRSLKNSTTMFVYLPSSNVEINEINFCRISDRLSPIYMFEKEATGFCNEAFLICKGEGTPLSLTKWTWRTKAMRRSLESYIINSGKRLSQRVATLSTVCWRAFSTKMGVPNSL
jgi:hypothetical protein